VLLGVEHLVRDAAHAQHELSSSLFCTEMVPTSTGWPCSCLSAMSSTTASYLDASLL
jgi:hypothetical protein